MSKMNELSVDYDALEKYEEYQRQQLRDEGKEEFRVQLIAQVKDVQKRHTAETTYDAIRYGAFEFVIELLEGSKVTN